MTDPINSRLALTLLAGILLVLGASACTSMSKADPDEARAIAREAYTYGFPLIENYKTIYAYAIDTKGSQYKAPFNQLKNEARVYTPEDTAVVTPNSDTPYSFVVMDLRAEPLILMTPAIEKTRYFSIQLVDLYTHNFDYIGTRTTGNGGGNYLLAGPDWEERKVAGIDKVIRCETQFALAIYRTQLLSPSDLEDVKQIQAGYRVRPLSAFLGEPAPPKPGAIDWPPPRKDMATSPALFGYLNFLLRFAPTPPSEAALMERFARIGVGAGLPFEPDGLSPKMKQALKGGIADAWSDFKALQARMDRGEVTSGDLFGTRAFLANNYLYRLAGAKIGLYGNSREEALYPIYRTDAEGEPLDASTNRYVLRFEKGGLPPAAAFWSLTLYDGKTQLLVDNPLRRYLLNSAMLDGFVRSPDGAITFHIQKDAPGKPKEANWLPAPDGPFYLVLRIYLPKPEVLEGKWKHPPLTRVR